MNERIKLLISGQGLSASKFAEKIGVQASGISHIISGRNKPGYDFIVKVLENFPEVNPDWLLLGEGGMFREDSTPVSSGTPESSGSLSPASTSPGIENKPFVNEMNNNIGTGDYHAQSVRSIVDENHAESPQNSDASGRNFSNQEGVTFTVNKTPIVSGVNAVSDNTHPAARGNSLVESMGASRGTGIPAHSGNFAKDVGNERAYVHVDNNVADGNIPAHGVREIEKTSDAAKKIESIVIFYSDKSFTSYTPGE